MKPFDVDNKLFFIVGGTSGLGSATAMRLAKSGARVALTGRNPEKLEKIVRDISSIGSRECSSVHCDLTKPEELTKAIETTVSKYGPIDGAIFCAGVYKVKPLRVETVPSIRETLDVNLVSAFELARLVSKRNHYSNEGCSIVFLASVMASAGREGLSAYCASKAGLVGLARSLSLELGPKKIRVNCVSPAAIMTEMVQEFTSTLNESQLKDYESRHPSGFGSEEDVAAACHFLLTSDAKWITGTDLVVDGGYLSQ